MTNTAVATHTPGPWTVTGGGVAGPDGTLIAQNVWFAQVDNDTLPNRWYFENGEANARLIAAAPEMLEALRAMLSEFGVTVGQTWDGIKPTDAETLAVAAIDKALGL